MSSHITTTLKYKKNLIRAVQEDPSLIYLNDPDFFNPVSGYLPDILKEKPSITVTNAKRQWFASITIDADQNIRIE